MTVKELLEICESKIVAMRSDNGKTVFDTRRNNKEFAKKYADVEAHSNHDYGFWTIIDVAKIVFEEEGEGMISYHRLTTGISVEACRANNDVDWVDRDSALRESFERCLRENIACSNEYCMA